MVKEVNITNKETHETIVLGAKAPYALDTIDWDSAAVEQTSYRVPFQIGQFLTGVQVGTRQISITGYVISDVSGVGKSWKQYYEECEQVIEEKKLQLDEIFSIYQDIEITVGDYSIIGRPMSAVKYSNNEEENNEVMCLFSITIQCFDPMFAKGKTFVSMASAESLFHFPMILKQTKIPFGSFEKKQSIVIENDGNVDVGFVATIKADNGSATNPRIYIVETGETLALNGITLDIGDVITIDTRIGNENITLHDVSAVKDINIIGKMIVGSKFFKIKRGHYTYAYGASANIDNLSVSIEFEEKYFNIRGM